MKRIISILLCVCLLLCMAACHKPAQPPQDTATTEHTAPENQPPAQAPSPTEAPVADSPADEDIQPIKLLTLEKALHTYYEWADGYDQAIVRSEHACVTLGQEDASLFPEMAEVLSQIATMQENAMLDEFYNLVSIASEELDSDFQTYISVLDVQVRRADSLVISLLTDSYADYGQIDNCRVLHGSNYDTQTGKALALNDVVDVNNDLALAVQKELTGHQWAGEFYGEYTVEEYFANTPYDGFSWTLDYNGVTFYFAPGLLCEGGAMTATVTFAEYPQLFSEKYMEAPAQYTVELPQHISFFTDLNADGTLEEISLSGGYNEERGHYLDYGVYTAEQDYREECFVYDLHPYYVKVDSGHYLYLFCEDFNEGLRQMQLVVLSLNEDGSITKCGEKNYSPAQADNIFIVPTDPNNLLLDDTDTGAQRVSFAVGEDGLPN